VDSNRFGRDINKSSPFMDGIRHPPIVKSSQTSRFTGIPSPSSCQAQILSHVLPSSPLLINTDAADAESPLKESELQVLRSQYVKEQEAQHITVQTKFNYAWGLIKSNRHPDQLEGVTLLTGTSSLIRPGCPEVMIGGGIA
jgi:hypothetical protein